MSTSLANLSRRSPQTLVECHESSGMFDVPFDTFVAFFRSTRTTSESKELAAQTVSMAAEASQIEQLTSNLAATSTIVDEANADVTKYRSKRVVGFTQEEKAFRLSSLFREKRKCWSEHVERLRNDYENLANRHLQIEGAEVALTDAIDGIVVDESVLSEEITELGDALREISDYLFDKLEMSKTRGAVASALALRSLPDASTDSDSDEDDETKYHRLYGALVTTLQHFKQLQRACSSLGSEIAATYEQLMKDKAEETAAKWDRELLEISRGGFPAKLRSLQVSARAASEATKLKWCVLGGSRRSPLHSPSSNLSFCARFARALAEIREAREDPRPQQIKPCDLGRAADHEERPQAAVQVLQEAGGSGPAPQ
jgi:hypothetical protein